MAKIQKFLRIITLGVLILLPVMAQAQFYSIDDENHMNKSKSKRYRPSPEERRVMKIEKSYEKKKKKQDKIDRKLNKKARKKHNKLINGGGRDLVGGKKTYKRMKKSKKEAEKNYGR